MKGLLERGLPAQIRFVQYHDRLFEKKPELDTLNLRPLHIGALQDFIRAPSAHKSQELSSRAEESSASDSQDTKPLDLDTSVQYLPDGEGDYDMDQEQDNLNETLKKSATANQQFHNDIPKPMTESQEKIDQQI